MIKAVTHLGLLAATTGWFAISGLAQETLTGSLGAHDPSTIIKDGSRYYVFTTGSGIPKKYSTDLHNWSSGGTVFGATPPTWATNAVPNFTNNPSYWAPDVAFFNGKFHLYYSISSWGTIDSAIGLVATTNLNTGPWIDQGKVVQSDASGSTQPETDTTSYNCIDPSILVDTNGTVWMVYGSYSDGILVTQIDPSTGKRLNPASIGTKIAGNGPVFFSNTTEGSHLHQRGGYYYLFLNFGGCCDGINSTYNIRVGRSASITGPYLDKDGANMLNGGGTLFLGTYRHYIGPGHAGVFSEGGTNWLSYHYYDGSANGSPTLGLRRLEWANGWPYLSKPGSAASAFYTFDVDARDHLAVRNGQLTNGAAITSETNRGGILTLDGVNASVKLPNSVANGNTFAAWVKWNGGNNWQRIFDFGDGTSRYLFLTPRADSGKMRFAITFTGGGGENRIEAPTAFPTNSWAHVAVTIKPGLGVLYLNGKPVGTNSVMTLLPSQILARTNYLGKSQWITDPYFNGAIDSFRIFDRALTSDEVRDLAYAHPALAHRYQFLTNASDTFGDANGELQGSAVVTNGSLILNGQAGNYVDLPGGLISGSAAVTLEFWATFGVNGNWTRVVDFGNISGGNGSQYFFFSPHNGSSGHVAERRASTTTTFNLNGTLDNRTLHVVCIVDPTNNYAAVYTNGVLENTMSGTWPAFTSVSTAWSFIGRSLFSSDAYLNATIDELRIYDGRLTPAEITANFKSGPDALALPVSITQSNSPANFTLSWPAWAVGFAAQGSTNLTSWTTNGLAPVLANDRWSLVISRTNAFKFFRLQR